MDDNPITVAAVLGFGAAYLKLAWDFYSAQSKERTERRERHRREMSDDRDDDRDDFKSNLDAFRERAQAAEHRAETLTLELAEYRGATDMRISALERENDRQREELDRLILQRCPWGRVDCPREREPAVVGRE